MVTEKEEETKSLIEDINRLYPELDGTNKERVNWIVGERKLSELEIEELREILNICASPVDATLKGKIAMNLRSKKALEFSSKLSGIGLEVGSGGRLETLRQEAEIWSKQDKTMAWLVEAMNELMNYSIFKVSLYAPSQTSIAERLKLI